MNKYFPSFQTLVCLAILAVPSTVQGHFFWADTDPLGQEVTVTFNENPGEPDGVIAMMEGKLKEMKYYREKQSKSSTVYLEMNENKTAFEGSLDFTEKPGFVTGFFDFGPFEKFSDLQYSFSAQIHDNDDSFDTFYKPIIQKIPYPTIALRHCGGKKDEKAMSYQFDVSGFPDGGELGVCLYRTGGVKVGCGEFDYFEYLDPEKNNGNEDANRNLRGDTTTNGHRRLTMTLEVEDDDVEEEEYPYLLYAMANKTFSGKYIDDADAIVFASTSVYFTGECSD